MSTSPLRIRNPPTRLDIKGVVVLVEIEYMTPQNVMHTKRVRETWRAAWLWGDTMAACGHRHRSLPVKHQLVCTWLCVPWHSSDTHKDLSNWHPAGVESIGFLFNTPLYRLSAGKELGAPDHVYTGTFTNFIPTHGNWKWRTFVRKITSIGILSNQSIRIKAATNLDRAW